jgi:SnoaL-like domain
MAQASNGEIVRRYWSAHGAHDYPALAALRHPEWTNEWPQSNERIRGHDNDRAMAEAYPGGLPGMDMSHVVGSDDQWVTGPSFPTLTVFRIAGTGDTWWTDGR